MSISPVIDLAKELMSRDSVTPRDAGCQEHIATLLSAAGFHCEHLRFENVDNLWARYGNQGPLLVFAGHTDVVPPGPVNSWQSPPFAPDIRDHFLYGRGACDMKAAIAAMVIAALSFVKQYPQFPGSIAFLLTSDEEGPSLYGTKKVVELLEKRGEKIQYCVIGEPSTDKVLGDQVRVGRRGSLTGSLTVYGKQGHVAHPHLAVNPIHQAMLALHELSQVEWDKGNAHFPPTTFQLTNIQSGTGAANVIPGQLEALFNLRFGTASQVSEIQRRCQAIFDEHQLHYDMQWTQGAEPFLTQQGKLLDTVKAAILETTGVDVRFSTGGGTSDGRFIAPTGAEVVELGLSHATAHQVDECIDVRELEKLREIYFSILKTIF
ncbi:MAG TPA: succinyl-diaminopimelate desuccinylase [Gammaproteobacteria bacterium]|jgi:succinyl-diaminopimelate desuccinylase|nr:succinyl-diaminopimelate desuccinylase [Gammaproteobacteria bacterium]